MSFKSLFKVQSIVAIVLVSFSVGTLAEDTPSPADIAAYKAAIGKYALASTTEDSDKCSTQDSAVNSLLQDQQASSDKMFEMQTNALQAQDTNQTAVLNLQQQAKMDANKQADALAAYNTKVQADNSQLIIDQNSAMSQTAQKLLELKSKITASNQAVLDANDKLRAAATAISQAQLDQESQCRQAATVDGNNKKQEIDKAYSDMLKANASGLSGMNYGSSGLAGVDNRRKAKRLIDIQNEYLNSYKNCMSGATGQTGKVQTALNAYSDAQKSYTAQLGQIKAEQADMQAALAQAQIDGKNALTAAQLAATNKLAADLTNYNSTLAQLQTDSQYVAAQIQQKQTMYWQQTQLSQKAYGASITSQGMASARLSNAMTYASTCQCKVSPSMQMCQAIASQPPADASTSKSSSTPATSSGTSPGTAAQ